MSDWTNSADHTPEHGKKVLAFYRNAQGHGRVIVGMYVGRFESEPSVYGGDDNSEYNDADDTFYIPEGWYECIENWDAYSSVAVQHEVTHWRPLQESPP